jgi:hypothetical protein
MWSKYVIHSIIYVFIQKFNDLFPCYSDADAHAFVATDWFITKLKKKLVFLQSVFEWSWQLEILFFCRSIILYEGNRQIFVKEILFLQAPFNWLLDTFGLCAISVTYCYV